MNLLNFLAVSVVGEVSWYTLEQPRDNYIPSSYYSVKTVSTKPERYDRRSYTFVICLMFLP